MNCKNCGAEIKEDALFCPNCGTEQGKDGTAFGVESAKRKTPIAIIATIAAGVAVLAIVVGIGAIFLIKRGDADKSAASGDVGGNGAASQLAGEEIPLYSNVRPVVVDLYAENRNPGVKAAGMEWDSTLFYWLEDCDTTSATGGNIARSRVTKTQMLTVDTWDLVQYEVYHNPDTDAVCKIVSIYKSGDELTLTDYYYQDGRPNFIFERTDSVYTPTYATIDKVGERYYFNNDVMVRWRMISEPRQIMEYTLAPGEVWYSQSGYYTESDEVRAGYDAKEREMLNRAYNILDAVTADSGIGTVDGYVRDTAGTPVSGAIVNIYRKTDDVLLYQMVTREDGRFQAYVYLDGEECYFTVAGDDTEYKATVVNGLNLADNSLIHSYDNLVLHKISGDEYQVHLDVCAANEARVDENGVLSCEKLRGVTVNFREGSDSRDGNVLLTAQASETGEITANLPSGTYTAELVADGYITTWMNIEVSEQETWGNGWMIPEMTDNQTAVVLTWEGNDTDLDLTVFTPNQSTAGDMAYVGGRIVSDGSGNLLIEDNPSGCEVIYLNTEEAGAFKIFVNDYTDSLAGNYNAGRLAAMNAHIYIYNSNGFAGDYAFPTGQNGVVWEVAEVNGNNVTSSQRTYTGINGKSWWITNKIGASEEDLVAALQEGSNLNRLLVDIAHEYVCDGEGNEGEILTNVNRLLQGDPESVLRFYGLHGDVPAHIPPVEGYESSDPDAYMKWYYMLSREQLEYAAYSLTGQQISFNSLDASVDGDGTGIGFGGLAGDITWNELHNFTIENAGYNIWRVKADVWYGCDGEELDAGTYKVAEITFLITGNSGSCYEEFRVAAVESVHLSEWKNAYRQIINQYQKEADSLSELRYNLVYLDADDIPELVVDCVGYWLSVYSYSSGQIYTIMDYAEYGLWGRYYMYVPYSGKVCSPVYAFEDEGCAYYFELYYLDSEHNLNYDYNNVLIAHENEDGCRYENNQVEITEEQFYDYLKGYQELCGRNDRGIF